MAKKKTVLQALKEVRKLLSDPKKWTKGALARDKNGYEVNLDSKNAVCFCLNGALYKVCGIIENTSFFNQNYNIAINAESEVAKHCKNGYVPEFNDSKHTYHKRMLAKLDKAIASALQKQKARKTLLKMMSL